MPAIEGVLSIDKPGGMTSHDVIQRVRRLTNIRRIGHAGTLDPLATGVLLLCVGRAARLVEYLVGQDKVYEATVRLGQTTNTYDAEGEVVAERPFSHITPGQIEQTLSQFRGPIQQRPPRYSAIKKDGQPLYKLARAGIDVEPPLREVTIYALEIEAVDLPEVRLRVSCSSGTYVRSLAHDLGQALGCGGHVTALRRVAVGDFAVETAVPLDQLTETNWQDYLLASDTAVAHLPRLNLSAAATTQLQNGQRPPRPDNQPPASLLRAYDPAGQFIGTITAHEEYLQARKIFL
ncbi:MAG: tRNA pseudouridine(55) synthase TruB [Anaerolineae bacterium]